MGDSKNSGPHFKSPYNNDPRIYIYIYIYIYKIGIHFWAPHFWKAPYMNPLNCGIFSSARGGL